MEDGIELTAGVGNGLYKSAGRAKGVDGQRVDGRGNG